MDPSSGTASTGQPNGQSQATAQTSINGTGGDSFFDYETIKGRPELESAYKEMQRSYSKKTQDIADLRTKAQQVDAFRKDPVRVMQQYASQLGYQMVKGQPTDSSGKPLKFDSWEGVMDESTRRSKAEVEAQFAPLFNEVKHMKQQNIEMWYDNNHPDWRVYEDRMAENLNKYKELINDPGLLYRISVPEEVLEARAMKAALAKLNGDAQSGRVSGQSATTQQTSRKAGKMSFDDAVKAARQSMKERGFSRPSE
jgi:hypothetical protein